MLPLPAATTDTQPPLTATPPPSAADMERLWAAAADAEAAAAPVAALAPSTAAAAVTAAAEPVTAAGLLEEIAAAEAQDAAAPAPAPSLLAEQLTLRSPTHARRRPQSPTPSPTNSPSHDTDEAACRPAPASEVPLKERLTAALRMCPALFSQALQAEFARQAAKPLAPLRAPEDAYDFDFCRGAVADEPLPALEAAATKPAARAAESVQPAAAARACSTAQAAESPQAAAPGVQASEAAVPALARDPRDPRRRHSAAPPAALPVKRQRRSGVSTPPPVDAPEPGVGTSPGGTGEELLPPQAPNGVSGSDLRPARTPPLAAKSEARASSATARLHSDAGGAQTDGEDPRRSNGTKQESSDAGIAAQPLSSGKGRTGPELQLLARLATDHDRHPVRHRVWQVRSHPITVESVVKYL